MKKALIVGIDNYPRTPLKGCVNDAIAIGNVLERDGDGSPNFAVKVLTDINTKGELIGSINELFSGDSETALFYFSGHGAFDNVGGGIIVTPDYKNNDLGVSMDSILQVANNSKIRNKVIILDCCHSGALGTPQVTGGMNAHIGEGVSILTASRKDEEAIEIKGRGLFTNLLLNALHGEAADLRGRITPGSIYSYIDQALGEWKQRPVFKTNITRFTALRTVAAPLSDSVLRKLTTYFSDAEDQYKLDPSFEFSNDPSIEHKCNEPYANKDNVSTFKDLQSFVSVGLVVPVDEDHMYYAAMNSKSCELTALGYHYWRLVKEGMI